MFVVQGGGGGPLKLGITETCERIKEEFNFIQNQYHSWVPLIFLPHLQVFYLHQIRIEMVVPLWYSLLHIAQCSLLELMLFSSRRWVKRLKDQIVRTFKTSRIFPLMPFNFTLQTWMWKILTFEILPNNYCLWKVYVHFSSYFECHHAIPVDW